MSKALLYESDSLIQALSERMKQYQEFQEKLAALEKTFQAIIDNSDFKGKGADNIKSFYQAHIDLVKDWRTYIEGVTAVFNAIPKMAQDMNLSSSTKVAVPFLEDDLETSSKNNKTMVDAEHDDLEKILNSIQDIVSISPFSTASFDTNIHKADARRKETIQAVQDFDVRCIGDFTPAASNIQLIPLAYNALINATNKAGTVQPMNFNPKTYQADEIQNVRKGVSQSIAAYKEQQAKMQKVRNEIAAENAKIAAENARIEKENNKPWYEKAWDGVKTFTGEFTGYYDSIRAATGVDPVTGRKLSPMERTAAGAMAAAGFIPVVGWAGRAVKGGVAIYRTAKGVSTATHMLKAFNTAKAMKVLNGTEKGIYGLLVANSAYEFRSGKDLLGNKLTEEQRQNALWNGLILSVSGGAATALNHAGKAKKAPLKMETNQEVINKSRNILDEVKNGTLGKTGQYIRESARNLGNGNLGLNPAFDGGHGLNTTFRETARETIRPVKREVFEVERKLEEPVGGSKGTDKDIQIPSVRNNEFNKWFDNLSVDKFEEMWSVPQLRSKIEDKIRRPGGYHEWHLVARTPKFKQWGVSMDNIKDMRTLTKDVEFANPPGRHGRRGSTKAHNEILKIIDSAPDYESFVRELNEWASKRMKNGVLDLPKGLRR